MRNSELRTFIVQIDDCTLKKMYETIEELQIKIIYVQYNANL